MLVAAAVVDRAIVNHCTTTERFITVVFLVERTNASGLGVALVAGRASAATSANQIDARAVICVVVSMRMHSDFCSVCFSRSHCCVVTCCRIRRCRPRSTERVDKNQRQCPCLTNTPTAVSARKSNDKQSNNHKPLYPKGQGPQETAGPGKFVHVTCESQPPLLVKQPSISTHKKPIGLLADKGRKQKQHSKLKSRTHQCIACTGCQHSQQGKGHT